MLNLLRPAKFLVKWILSPEAIARIALRKSRWDLCRARGFKYWRMSRYKEISGFMMDAEAVELFQIVREIEIERPVLVEIGSWVGKSTVIIGSALGKKRQARLFCIDPFDGTGGTDRDAARYRQEMAGMHNSLLATFKANITNAGLSARVSPVPGFSNEVVKTWSEPIDFLFIDANHDHDAVRRDFLDWSPFVKPGGVIALHDVWLAPPPEGGTFWAGPGDIVRELVLPDPQWKRVSYVHSLFTIRKAVQ